MVVRKGEESSKPREENEKIDPKKTLLVAQEISFAKVLAGNDKRLRDRGVKRLHRWLKARSKGDSDLNEDDFLRLWKGLYYCMWMADKPLFQEELAETISSLIHCIHLPGPTIRFIEGFYRIMALEWKGIDQHRLDKFLMLVRRFLRQCLVFVDNNEWNIEIVEQLSSAFQRTLLPHNVNQAKVQPPLGLVMHFTEIFLEELAKVSKGSLDENVLLCFLKPFAQSLASSRDGRIRNQIRLHIFIRLLKQTPVALEYEEKLAAWCQLGCPGGTLEVMQKADGEEEDGDDEEAGEEDDEIIQNVVNNTGPLDPRAGGIDVELPLLNFEPKNIVKLLNGYKFQKYTNAKTRKSLSDIISKFDKLSEGDYSLGVKEVPDVPPLRLRKVATKAAEELDAYKSALRAELDEGDDFDEEIDPERDAEEEEEEAGNSNEDVESSDETSGISAPKLKKAAKRKKSELKKKVVKNKKARFEIETDNLDESVSEEEEEEADENKITKKISKKKKISNLKSTNMVKLINEVNSVKKKRKSQVDVEVEKLAKIEIAPSDSSDAKKPAEHELSSQPRENGLNTQSGTHVLLQHLAPHVVESKKLKRRASCDARLQTATGEKKSKKTSPSSSKSDSAKKSKKRNSLGWDEPLQDGEFEIFIPKEEIVARKKRLSDANESLSSPNTLGSKLKNPFSTPTITKSVATPGSSSKKVNFVLQRNTAQATSDYFRTLRENPAIPYDAKKEPPRGVLKPSPYSSPVNPFYKRKLKV